MEQFGIKRHKDEWHKRLSYDPQYAISPREQAILKMISISTDKTLPTDQILREVALLAAPHGSKIYISEEWDGYAVNVSFEMALMSSGEFGSFTKHSTVESLREEVIDIIGRVMKDLYEHSR
jgi:hypothetical protein